jgi:hypothetical protein
MSIEELHHAQTGKNICMEELYHADMTLQAQSITVKPILQDYRS